MSKWESVYKVLSCQKDVALLLGGGSQNEDFLILQKYKPILKATLLIKGCLIPGDEAFLVAVIFDLNNFFTKS